MVLNTFGFLTYICFLFCKCLRRQGEKFTGTVCRNPADLFWLTYFTQLSLRECSMEPGLWEEESFLIRCFLEFMLLLKVRLVGGRIPSCFSSFARTLCSKTTVWTLTCVPVISGMLSDLSVAAQLGPVACFVVPDIAVANLERVQAEQDTEVRTSKRCQHSQCLESLRRKVMQADLTSFWKADNKLTFQFQVLSSGFQPTRH